MSITLNRTFSGAFTATLVAILIAACSSDTPDDSVGPGPLCNLPEPEVSTQNIVVTDIRSIQVVLKNEEGSSSEPILTDSETRASLSDIEIQVEMEYEATPIEAEKWSVGMLLDWLMPPAHACSPIYQEGDVRSLLHSIDMHSAADMNARYPAGQSLASLFQVHENAVEGVFYGDFGRVYRRNMAALGGSSQRMMLDFVISAEEGSELIEDTVLDDNVHRFTLSVELKDGRAFSMDSNDVFLTGDTSP